MRIAIDGGEPTRKTLLPYGQQWIDEEDVATVVATLTSDFLTQGPKIEEFEEAIASYIGVKYAVAFTNGTAALHAACYAAGVTVGDEVITTPITFAASANCVLYMGAKPVFVDIDAQTYNIDPALIEAAITEQTKAIVVVDFTGQPVDLGPIMEIAKKYNLILIEDAAHALGATYKGVKVGSLADMTMFSFHPVKHITTGEGGMIVTNSEHFAKRLRLFRSHGILRDPQKLIDEPWLNEMVDLGFNYRLTDIQAALGISQLDKLNLSIKRRKEIVAIYNQAFEHMKGIILPYQLPETESSWHLYIIKINSAIFNVGRKEIFKALRAENIGVNVHYIPVYYHPYYQQLGYQKGQCSVAEQWYEEAITLPLFPKMTDEDVNSVIRAVEKVINYYLI